MTQIQKIIWQWQMKLNFKAKRLLTALRKVSQTGEQVQLEGEKNSKIDTNKEDAPDTDDNKIVTIGKMNGGNMYRVPEDVQGKTVLAIVYTAAKSCTKGQKILHILLVKR